MSCGVGDLGNPPVQLLVEDQSHPEAVEDAVQNGTAITFTYHQAVNSELGNASLRCSAGTSLGGENVGQLNLSVYESVLMSLGGGMGRETKFVGL